MDARQYPRLSLESVARQISEAYHVPLAEIAAYEGLLATLEQRREKLAKRWAAKITPVPKAIAKSFDSSALVGAVLAHHQTTLYADDMGTGAATADHKLLRDAAKGAALFSLRQWLRDNPAEHKAWTALVSQAEAEAAAEGVAQATALLRDAGFVPRSVELDLDQLFTDTVANLRVLDSYGKDAPAWITDQLDGLAGDMGRVIAGGIVHNFGPDELVKAVNDVIAKGEGAQAYIDESINTAMKRAELGQLIAGGVEMFDYVTVPGACADCDALEGTYSLSNLPEPPQHFRCRCSVAPAGTI